MIQLYVCVSKQIKTFTIHIYYSFQLYKQHIVFVLYHCNNNIVVRVPLYYVKRMLNRRIESINVLISGFKCRTHKCTVLTCTHRTHNSIRKMSSWNRSLRTRKYMCVWWSVYPQFAPHIENNFFKLLSKIYTSYNGIMKFFFEYIFFSCYTYPSPDSNITI